MPSLTEPSYSYPDVIATGAWRENTAIFQDIKQKIEKKGNMFVLKQPDESLNSAKFAYDLMKEHNLLQPYDTNMLFVEGGRGSTQFVVMNSKQIIKFYDSCSGFPKTNINYKDKNDICNEIIKDFSIGLIVAVGSIFHILKKSSPVIPNEGILPCHISLLLHVAKTL